MHFVRLPPPYLLLAAFALTSPPQKKIVEEGISRQPLSSKDYLFAAMGNETVLESVQVFGRKVSWQCGAMAAPLAQGVRFSSGCVQGGYAASGLCG